MYYSHCKCLPLDFYATSQAVTKALCYGNHENYSRFSRPFSRDIICKIPTSFQEIQWKIHLIEKTACKDIFKNYFKSN